MKGPKEKAYWESNFQAKLNPNELYFNWYDNIRLKFFKPFGKNGYALEIGAGSGEFAQKARIDVAVDISQAALLNLKAKHQCLAVVADASRLPFKANSFQNVYVNDVFHHLKAQGLLEDACAEIKRVLGGGGLLFVSDRAPLLYNRILLKLNYFFRGIFHLLIRDKGVRFSGSLDEPAMTDGDYKVICREMKVLSRQEWKNFLVFWVYGAQQFLNVIFTENMRQKCAAQFVYALNRIEGKTSRFLKTDLCLIMQKNAEDGLI